MIWREARCGLLNVTAKFGFHRTQRDAYNEWDENREMYQEIWECELK